MRQRRTVNRPVYLDDWFGITKNPAPPSSRDEGAPPPRVLEICGICEICGRSRKFSRSCSLCPPRRDSQWIPGHSDENLKIVVWSYFSPGRRTVVGNSG